MRVSAISFYKMILHVRIWRNALGPVHACSMRRAEPNSLEEKNFAEEASTGVSAASQQRKTRESPPTDSLPHAHAMRS
jgi:hypothetical protein